MCVVGVCGTRCDGEWAWQGLCVTWQCVAGVGVRVCVCVAGGTPHAQVPAGIHTLSLWTHRCL